MQTTTCPNAEQLKAYLSGKLDDDSSDTLAQHLLACPACEESAAQLEADPDTLVELLQLEVPPSESPRELQCEMQHDSLDSSLVGGKSCSTAESWSARLPEVLGQYKLLSRLGTGGMGAVYLAHHLSLDKQVAIKLLPVLPATHTDFLARFQREMRAAGRLDHPAIVRTTDAGEQQGIHFLVMDAIDGMDLGRLLRVEEKMSVADACEVVRQAAIGLSHAHEKGIVHRDVKPSNVMLDVNGQVRLLDFGLAQIGLWESGTAEITTVGQLMGTLDYMAPEQAERGGAVDYRADLYSLGATLFRMLTGRAPLAAAPNLTPLEKLRLLATHRPPKLRSFRPDAPEKLCQIVDAMLAREPSGRPASAMHVAELLEPFGTEADLVTLLNRTRTRPVADEPSFVLNPLLQRDLAENRQSVSVPADVDWLGKFNSTGGQRSSNGSNWLTWLSLAGFLALLCAGIWLVLETSQGQLVIDSEAEVQVKLVSINENGQRSEIDQLKIVPGTKSTRLSSGKYEITLDAASDAVSLSNGIFRIQNGQTVVATIKQQLKPADNTALDDPLLSPLAKHATAANEDPRLNEVVFDNEKLDTWLRRLKFERNPEEIDRTLNAIQQLASEDLRDVIREPLLEFILREGTLKHHRSAMSALEKCTGSRLHETVGYLLSQSSNDRIKYLILHYSIDEIADRAGSSIKDSLFFTEAAKLLSSKDRTCALQTGIALRKLTCEVPDRVYAEDLQQAVIRALAATEALTNENFWLASPTPSFVFPTEDDGLITLPNGLAMNRELCQRAIAALVAPTTSEPIKIQACVLLQSLVDAGVAPTEAKLEQLTKWIAGELSQATNDPSLYDTSIEVHGKFTGLVAPRLPYIRNDDRVSQAYVMIQILNVATALSLQDTLKPELQKLFQSLHQQAIFDNGFVKLLRPTSNGNLMRRKFSEQRTVVVDDVPGWAEIVEKSQEFGFYNRVVYLQVGSMLGKSSEELFARYSTKQSADITAEIDRNLKLFANYEKFGIDTFKILFELPLDSHPGVVPAIEASFNESQKYALSRVFPIWTKAAGDEFLASLARVLAKADEQSIEQLNNVDVLGLVHFRCTKPLALEPFLSWCDQAIANRTREKKTTVPIIHFLTNLTMDSASVSVECQQMVVDRLASYTVLDNRDFWIANLVIETGTTSPWGPPMRKAILSRALAVIADDNAADGPELCQALAVARNGLPYWETVPANIRKSAIDRIGRHLETATKDPNSVALLQPISYALRDLAIPIYVRTEAVFQTDSNPRNPESSNAVIMMLNLLTSVYEQNSHDQRLESLKTKIQALHSKIEQLNLSNESLSFSLTRGGTWESFIKFLDVPHDQLLMHIWFVQTGGLLGKEVDELHRRPMLLAREYHERQRRFVQPRDTLAIHIPGILPQSGDPPIIQAGKSTPVVGVPVPVSQDGTIQLPLLDPIKVIDLELPQVKGEIERRYSEATIVKLPFELSVNFLLRAGSAVELRNIMGNSTVATPAQNSRQP